MLLNETSRRLPKQTDDPGEPWPPVAIVEWGDAWSDPGPITEDELRPDYPCTSVGFLLRQGKVVTVATTRDREGWQDVLSIPKGMVRKVTVLK